MSTPVGIVKNPYIDRFTIGCATAIIVSLLAALLTLTMTGHDNDAANYTRYIVNGIGYLAVLLGAGVAANRARTASNVAATTAALSMDKVDALNTKTTAIVASVDGQLEGRIHAGVLSALAAANLTPQPPDVTKEV